MVILLCIISQSISSSISQSIYRSVYKHVEDSSVVSVSQQGFVKSMSYLSNLLSFYDKVIDLVNRGEVVDVTYLNFRKVFDTVPMMLVWKYKSIP